MKTILVIDDEREVLDIVRSTLKTRGHEVHVTDSGREGIRFANERFPDLVICDLMMPEVSGIQVVKTLKANSATSEIPIIIISPVEPTEEKTEEYWATGLGVDEYLAKPFDPLDLLGRVEYLLRRSQYVSHRPKGGSEPPKKAEAPRVATSEQIAEATPAELVRIYNECWNQRDWATEYSCLTDETTHWIPWESYEGGREKAWSEAGGSRQKLVHIDKETINEHEAEVICEREDAIDGRAWKKRVTFELKKGPGGWRIRRSNEEPIRRDMPRILD